MKILKKLTEQTWRQFNLILFLLFEKKKTFQNIHLKRSWKKEMKLHNTLLDLTTLNPLNPLLKKKKRKIQWKKLEKTRHTWMKNKGKKKIYVSFVENIGTHAVRRRQPRWSKRRWGRARLETSSWLVSGGRNVVNVVALEESKLATAISKMRAMARAPRYIWTNATFSEWAEPPHSQRW